MKFLALLWLLTGCIPNPSPGNIGLICHIETDLEFPITLQLMDSLHQENMYTVPDDLKNEVDIECLKIHGYKNFYFKDSPKEIYSVTFGGFITIQYIYDVEKGKLMNGEDKFSDLEIKRIQTRFKNTVLKDVKLKAKELGISDSDLYHNK